MSAEVVAFPRYWPRQCDCARCQSIKATWESLNLRLPLFDFLAENVPPTCRHEPVSVALGIIAEAGSPLARRQATWVLGRANKHASVAPERPIWIMYGDWNEPFQQREIDALADGFRALSPDTVQRLMATVESSLHAAKLLDAAGWSFLVRNNLMLWAALKPLADDDGGTDDAS